MLTYQDYLLQARGRGEGSAAPMSQAAWDSMDEAGKWRELGGLFEVNPGDPRYNDLSQSILAQQPNANVNNVTLSNQRGGFNPAQTLDNGDGTYVWSNDNTNHIHDTWRDFAGALLPLGAGLLDFAGMFPWSGAAETGALTSGLPDSYWSAMADSGATASDAGEGLLTNLDPLGPGGGLDPETWAGNGGMSAAQNGIGPGNSLWDRISNTFTNPGSIVDWATANPLAAARLGLSAASLVGAARDRKDENNPSTGANMLPWQNGQIPSFNPQFTPFKPNPNLFQPVPFMGGH